MMLLSHNRRHYAPKLVVVLLVALALLVAACQGVAGLHVNVAGSIAVVEDGFGQVQPQLFGLCAYGQLPNVTFIKSASIHVLGTAITTQDFFLPPQPESGSGPWTAQAVERHFELPRVHAGLLTGELAKELRTVALAGADVVPHLYVVSLVPGQRLGNVSACVHKSDMCVPANATVWGTAARDFLKVMATVNPELSHAHLLNEPNAHWWHVRNPATGKLYTGTDYAAFFNTAAAVIHGALPNLKIGGPVTYNPPTGDQLSTQRVNEFPMYAQPLLDSVNKGQLDYFDFHAYDNSGRYLVSEVMLVKGYSAAQLRGKAGGWLRSAITENSFTLPSQAAWENRTAHFMGRTLPLADVTLRLAAHPDKLFARHIFNYMAPGNAFERVAGTGIKGDSMEVTPEEQLLHILGPFANGQRLNVTISTTSSSSSSYVEAVLQQGSGSVNVTVAALNEGPTAEPLYIESVMAGATPQHARGRVLDAVSYRPVASVPLPGSGMPLTLPPHSLTVVTFEYKSSSSSTGWASHTLARSEHYCDAFMMPIISTTAKCVVTMPAATAATATSWRLRVSMKEEVGSPAGSWRISLQGMNATGCGGWSQQQQKQQQGGALVQVELQAPAVYVDAPLSVGAATREAGVKDGSAVCQVAVSIEYSGAKPAAAAAGAEQYLKVLALVSEEVSS